MAYFSALGGTGGTSATITVTYSEDFYGQTITATNGTTTLTKTATSSGTLVFDVSEGGTWVVSGTVEGATYSEQVDVFFEYTVPPLVALPNGSTALPVNDIQTWLKCAGITDKTTYSTLADVLADTETFIALCADSNACNYMARSTTWALAEGLVPVMTDNTHPSGTCVRSTVYNSSFEAYKGFDGDESSQWTASTSDSVNNSYLGYTSSESIIVKRIRLYTPTWASGTRISAFKFQGYNGSSWEDIGEITGRADGNTYYTFPDNNTPYSGHRVLITGASSNAFSNGAVAINTLQFYSDADITTNPTAMLIVGKYNYCANALLGNSTWASAICNSTYFEYVLNVKVPIMTSATTPSGQVLYSSQYNATDWQAWHVFDRNNSATNGGWAAATNDSYGNMYVGYRFTNAVKVNLVSLYTNISSSTLRVVGFRIQAKNTNDSEWTTLLTVTNRNTNEIEYYSFSNDNSYTDYKIVIDSAQSGVVVDSARLTELQFYGRTPVSQTHTLIHSAVEDSIFYMDEGTPVALCTIASGDTEDVDMEAFKGQTLTLVSTVAKDPTNLSNDFSMNVRITPNITEIYLMPVKELYWYGHESKLVEDTSPANGWSHSGWTFIAPNRRTNYIDLHASTSISDTKVTGIGTKWANNLATNVHCVYTGITLAYDDYGILSICSTKDIDGTRLSYESLTSNTMTKITKQIATGNYAGLAIGRSRQAYVHALWLE